MHVCVRGLEEIDRYSSEPRLLINAAGVCFRSSSMSRGHEVEEDKEMLSTESLSSLMDE